MSRCIAIEVAKLKRLEAKLQDNYKPYNDSYVVDVEKPVTENKGKLNSSLTRHQWIKASDAKQLMFHVIQCMILIPSFVADFFGKV